MGLILLPNLYTLIKPDTVYLYSLCTGYFTCRGVKLTTYDKFFSVLVTLPHRTAILRVILPNDKGVCCVCGNPFSAFQLPPFVHNKYCRVRMPFYYHRPILFPRGTITLLLLSSNALSSSPLARYSSMAFLRYHPRG